MYHPRDLLDGVSLSSEVRSQALCMRSVALDRMY